MGKTVAVLIRDRERQYEGLRSSLGLLLEDHAIDMFVLDHEVDPTEEYAENAAFIDEMGGTRLSNERTNVTVHGFGPVTLEELTARMAASDLVVPF